MPPTEPTNLVASTKCIKVFTFNYGWKVNKMNILDNTVQAKLQCFSQTGRNLCLCLIRVIIPCVTTEQSQKQRSTKKFSNIHNKLCGDSIAYSNKDYKRKHWELILLCFFFCQEKKTRFGINIIHLPPPQTWFGAKMGQLDLSMSCPNTTRVNWHQIDVSFKRQFRNHMPIYDILNKLGSFATVAVVSPFQERLRCRWQKFAATKSTLLSWFCRFWVMAC